MSAAEPLSGPERRDEMESANALEASAPPNPTIEEAHVERRPADRGVPSVNRVRSVQTRVSSALAFTLMATLGGGLLFWYYRGTASRPAQRAAAAASAAKARASGEMSVPPLAHVVPPKVVAADAPAAASVSPVELLAQKLLAAPPEPAAASPAATPSPGVSPNAVSTAPTGGPESTARIVRSPAEELELRQLSGPVFAVASDGGPSGRGSTETEASGSAHAASGETGTPLGALLHPTAAPAAEARVLPTRELLLPKGSFLDCTLETAIDSSLPGLTTCVTATDTYSADGRVVLLERGTKLIGETRGEAQRGSNRLFVLWSEARTPTGVVVELASPGTDALGRSGVAGDVNRHFWERFGAAILVSVVNGGIQAGVESARSGNAATVVVGPGGAQDVMSEALKDTVSIPPTVTVPQGSRIQVLVARDLDFRTVYDLQLRPTPAP